MQQQNQHQLNHRSTARRIHNDNQKSKNNSSKRIPKIPCWVQIGIILCTLCYLAVSFVLFHRATHSLDDNKNNIALLAPTTITDRTVQEQDVVSPEMPGVSIPKKDNQNQISNKNELPERTSLLSRNALVQVTADVRGNLGPASVLIQDPPGTNWLKDRWQAASDMHGTAIRGSHWVMLDFWNTGNDIAVSKVVLDWESAHATEYRIEVGRRRRRRHVDDNTNIQWKVLFDASDRTHLKRRSVVKFGQSPGVKFEMPLHFVHTIDLFECCCYRNVVKDAMVISICVCLFSNRRIMDGAFRSGKWMFMGVLLLLVLRRSDFVIKKL